MAVKLPDGKIARTQPEQVKKNMDDIESINSELDIIKEGIASAYKIQGSEDVADLNALEKAEDMNGYVYNMLDAGNLVNEDASTLAVQLGDNVVFVWNGGDWYWDRLAGLVDTSNLCTLDTDQTITGEKTFNSEDAATYIKIKNNNSETNATDFGRNGVWTVIRHNGVNKMNLGPNDWFFYSKLQPGTNNNFDLGASTLTWKDLYISGKINLNASNSTTITTKTDGELVIDRNGTTIFNFGNTNGTVRSYYNFTPTANAGASLGTATYRWANLYLSGNLSDGTNSISVAQLHKIIKHQITANGKTVQVFSYYDGSYSGETIASIFGSVAGSTAWGMKATSELNNPDLIVVSDGGLAYFTGTGTFTKYLDPTDTITADSYSVWE